MNVWPHHCDPIVKWPLCLLAKAERQSRQTKPTRAAIWLPAQITFSPPAPNATEGIEYRRPKVVYGS
jgi:hypothetical protein